LTNAVVKIAYNGLALGDVADESELSCIGEDKHFREKKLPAI
jgi:hypothetical protein